MFYKTSSYELANIGDSLKESSPKQLLKELIKHLIYLALGFGIFMAVTYGYDTYRNYKEDLIKKDGKQYTAQVLEHTKPHNARTHTIPGEAKIYVLETNETCWVTYYNDVKNLEDGTYRRVYEYNGEYGLSINDLAQNSTILDGIFHLFLFAGVMGSCFFVMINMLACLCIVLCLILNVFKDKPKKKKLRKRSKAYLKLASEGGNSSDWCKGFLLDREPSALDEDTKKIVYEYLTENIKKVWSKSTLSILGFIFLLFLIIFTLYYCGDPSEESKLGLFICISFFLIFEGSILCLCSLWRIYQRSKIDSYKMKNVLINQGEHTITERDITGQKHTRNLEIMEVVEAYTYGKECNCQGTLISKKNGKNLFIIV